MQVSPNTPVTTTGRPSRAQAKRIYQDGFIREISVSYQPTKEPAFEASRAANTARFVRDIPTDNSREQLVALFLDASFRVTAFSVVSIGTASSVLAHPREIFQRAISAGAVFITLAHTRPSNDVVPGHEDYKLLKRMSAAGSLLGIHLMDLVIVAETTHYSFSEMGS